MTLIDGKAISAQVKQEIAAEVAQIVAAALTWPPSWWAMTVAARHTWPTR